MNTYEFTLIIPDIDDEMADAVYGVCNDASLGKSNGVTYVAFDSEAESLEIAIRFAIDNLRSVGVEPIRLEMEIYAAQGG